eukprot:1162128-Pelagomonas_calceolata.AAC.4
MAGPPGSIPHSPAIAIIIWLDRLGAYPITKQSSHHVANSSERISDYPIPGDCPPYTAASSKSMECVLAGAPDTLLSPQEQLFGLKGSYSENNRSDLQDHHTVRTVTLACGGPHSQNNRSGLQHRTLKTIQASRITQKNNRSSQQHHTLQTNHPDPQDHTIRQILQERFIK